MADKVNTVTAKIKLRTSLPTGKTIESDDYSLEEGEVYVDSPGTNKISIYIGDGETAISELKPIILTRTTNGNYEPQTIGGFTNNGESIGGGTISSATIKKMIADGGDIVGTTFPSSATEGQIFFKVN